MASGPWRNAAQTWSHGTPSCLAIASIGSGGSVRLVVGAVLGIRNAFNSLGLQAAFYKSAPAELMGSAGGLFQTFRYARAIVAKLFISAEYGAGATSDRIHVLPTIMAVISLSLPVAKSKSLLRRNSGR